MLRVIDGLKRIQRSEQAISTIKGKGGKGGGKGAMGKWGPAPPELVNVFETAAKSVPEATLRKMFGYPAVFMNGNMFAGLHQENMVLRLSESDRAGFRKLKGAVAFEPMPGRQMKEYTVVPEALLAKPHELDKWLAKAFAYASSLPPKEKKARKKNLPEDDHRCPHSISLIKSIFRKWITPSTIPAR